MNRTDATKDDLREGGITSDRSPSAEIAGTTAASSPAPDEAVPDADAPSRADAPVAATSTVLMSGRFKVVAVAAIFLAAIGYLAVYAFNEATTQYKSVDEVAASFSGASGDSVDASATAQVGIIAKLVDGSYIKSPDGITANFRVRDEDGVEELPVVYAGEIGEVFFNEHSELIMTGAVQSDGVFHAEQMTVRCPSKYLTQEGDAPY